MNARELERFMVKVEKTDSCWIWTAAKIQSGYGRFRTADGRFLSAHRLSYEHFVGPIPDGLPLDHLCRIPSCVRPDHLEPVTHRENLMRGNTRAAENAAKTHCVRGHEFDAENTRVGKNGGRVCRTCERDNARSRYQSGRRRDLRPERQASHCAKGHPLSGENLRIDKVGKRICVECARARCRASYHKRRATSPEKM